MCARRTGDDCGGVGDEGMDDMSKLTLLYQTIGSAMWLESLTDEEFIALCLYVMPVLVKAAEKRPHIKLVTRDTTGVQAQE
jgi:hypothetical protein